MAPVLAGLAALATLRGCLAQYREDSPKFAEEMAVQEAALASSLEAGSWVEDTLFPGRQYEDIDVYEYDFPPSVDYRIGIIVDPCKGTSYDCCHRFYGSPQYAIMPNPDTTSYRVVDKPVFADPGEILSNVDVIDEDGVAVDVDNSRFADDEIVIDDNCTAAGTPQSYCTGARKRMQRSAHVAQCTDNNQTVSAYGTCYGLDGSASSNCMAVGYSQTAFSVICGGDHALDEHCGTFMEVHMGFANDYTEVEDVLSEMRVDQANVTGFTTATIPLTWQNDTDKVLCAFEHTSLLVGTQALVASDAPRCCCPRAYSQKDLLGSFVCPVVDSNEAPFAKEPLTVEEQILYETDLESYPYCPWLPASQDQMMVSDYDGMWNRSFTREAVDMTWDNSSNYYTSSDVSGGYDAVCEYFDQCGQVATGGSCDGDDREFSFAGYVGQITYVPDDTEDEQYGVTFNDGRSVYYFNKEHLQVEADYNYEIWWVQRTLYNFRVQKRKPFKVTSPTCTFDTVNNQYFPYAMLDENGPMD